MAEEQIQNQKSINNPVSGNSAAGVGVPVKKGMLSQTIANIRDLFVKKPAKGPASDKKFQDLFSGLLSFHKLNLKTVNRVLILFLVGIIGLTVYSGTQQKPSIVSVAAGVSRINYEDSEENPVMAFGELSYYLDEVNSRDIFNEFQEKKPEPPPPEVKVEEPPPPPPPPKVTIEEKAKDLVLMGISWGDSPKVILRNDANQEVLFLRKGERIDGTELRVKDILKNEVIISSGEDEMKMF